MKNGKRKERDREKKELTHFSFLCRGLRPRANKAEMTEEDYDKFHRMVIFPMCDVLAIKSNRYSLNMLCSNDFMHSWR